MTTLRLANIPFFEVFGMTASYIVIGLSVMIALEQIGVVKTVAAKTFFMVLGVVPIVFFIMFLVGGKDIMSNIIAGHFIRKKYKKGDTLEIGVIKGEVDSVDLITTKIIAQKGDIYLPNAQLIHKEVTIINK